MLTVGNYPYACMDGKLGNGSAEISFPFRLLYFTRPLKRMRFDLGMEYQNSKGEKDEVSCSAGLALLILFSILSSINCINSQLEMCF